MRRSARVVGLGRAGGSFATALAAAGWQVHTLTHAEASAVELSRASAGVDLVLLTVPDVEISKVASRIGGDDSTLVAHCSGALGLDVLASVARRGSIHPLVALPDPTLGSELLRGAWFAVSGDPLLDEVVASLAGRSFAVTDDDRALYHAGAVIASNHLVALLAQVEGVAAELGIPTAAYLELAQGAIGSVERLGAAAALTGPVTRGDWETVRKNLAALPRIERDAYLALARRAALLAGVIVPDDL